MFLCSVRFYSVLLCFALLCCALPCLALLCFTLLYSALLCLTLLYSALLCLTLLYSAVLCLVLLYSALLCFTLLYSALLCFTLLYSALPCCTLLQYTERMEQIVNCVCKQPILAQISVFFCLFLLHKKSEKRSRIPRIHPRHFYSGEKGEREEFGKKSRLVLLRILVENGEILSGSNKIQLRLQPPPPKLASAVRPGLCFPCFYFFARLFCLCGKADESVSDHHQFSSFSCFSGPKAGTQIGGNSRNSISQRFTWAK